jgi:hypothetical protein
MKHSTQGAGRPGKIVPLLAASAACAILAACGGGGGSGSGGATPMSTSSGSTGGHSMPKPQITQGLWIANGTNVLEYTPPQLAAGDSAMAPKVSIDSSAFGAPQGVTFDAAGNLWVMDPQANVNGTMTPALLEFSAAQLAALPQNDQPQPITVITTSGLMFPQQSVFDAQGNQWVTDHNANAIYVFTSSQLAQTGVQDIVPAVTITSAAFNGPLGIVFDTSGDLFIANNGGVPTSNSQMSAVGTSIVEFTAGQLPSPASAPSAPLSLVPDIVLNDDGQGSVQGPWALVFDKQGDLWSSNANAPFTLVEFPAAVRTTSGDPTPAIIISPATVGGNATLNAPNGICFDNLGDLAALDSAGSFGLALFGAGQLGSGTQDPMTFIVGNTTTLNAPAGCNFGPVVQ